MSPTIPDYELGRLLACEGEYDSARIQFELVISGKHLEVGSSGKKVRNCTFLFQTDRHPCKRANIVWRYAKGLLSPELTY